jgi:hypothetical protein
MKVKSLIACAATAAALPLASAWAVPNATTLGGPSGTGFYGNVDPITEYYYQPGMLPPEERGAASVGASALSSYDVNRDGVISVDEQRAADTRVIPQRDSYSGPSWATNPPAPAQ